MSSYFEKAFCRAGFFLLDATESLSHDITRCHAPAWQRSIGRSASMWRRAARSAFRRRSIETRTNGVAALQFGMISSAKHLKTFSGLSKTRFLTFPDARNLVFLFVPTPLRGNTAAEWTRKELTILRRAIIIFRKNAERRHKRNDS